MGFFEIWAFMSGCKIPKISPFCLDYIRHTPFLPKFVRIVHQGSKFAKIVRISASGFKKLPRAVRVSGMAYRTPFGFGNDCKLAFSCYSKGTSPEPPPPLSFVTVFFTPFLAVLRNFTACPTCSNFCFGLENIQNLFPPVEECVYLCLDKILRNIIGLLISLSNYSKNRSKKRLLCGSNHQATEEYNT